jgi:hypothetical protein
MPSTSEEGLAEESEGDGSADDEPADVVDPLQAPSNPTSTMKWARRLGAVRDRPTRTRSSTLAQLMVSRGSAPSSGGHPLDHRSR